MKSFLFTAGALFYSACLMASPRQTLEIPVSIPIVDAVQHQQVHYFASHAGLLKLSDGSLFKLKDSGLDLGRLRQIELSRDQSLLYAAGSGLWEVTLNGYKTRSIYPGWVNRFAVSDKYYYVDDGEKVFAISKDQQQQKTEMFDSSVTSLAQADNEIFALTSGGLYAMVNTSARIIRPGNFKNLLANPLYLVMTEQETLHVFSRSTNQWYEFALPDNVTKLELSALEDVIWLRTNGTWKKHSLIDFRQLDSVTKQAAFLYDSPAGPILFDGTHITLNQKASLFDQTKPLVPSATFEPYIFQNSNEVYASGAGGIYSVNSGEIVVSTKDHIKTFYTEDGESFLIGTTKGAVFPDGTRLEKGFVADIIKHEGDIYIAFDSTIYKFAKGVTAEIVVPELKGQEILNLRSLNGELYILTADNIYKYGQSLDKVASIEHAVWEDLIELDDKVFALSYNHGIYQLLGNSELKKVQANQTLPTRFFIHNKTTYAFGREGICRMNAHDMTCKQISAGVTGKFINVTSNGIYYTNPHGVWMLDERALMAEPKLQYAIYKQKPVLDKNITLAAGESIALHFDLKDGTAYIAGTEYPIYNHLVLLTPEDDFAVDGWYFEVKKTISWFWLFFGAALVVLAAFIWALHRAKNIASAEFVRLSRFQLHADEIRRACDMSVVITDNLNANNDLALSHAIYLSQELQELLSPLAMNARLRESDDLIFALKSHVASIFSIHPELKVKIGECDPINTKLNADAYHLLLHMVRYVIDRLGAQNIKVHVLSESESDALLCVEHDGKQENLFHRLLTRSTDHLIMTSIAKDYGQQIKFYPSEMNVHLHYDPEALPTPKQAYFSASASKFGS